MRPEDVINLAAYPIVDHADPARAALIQRLKAELDAKQYVSLPDFILPRAIEKAVAGRRSRSPACLSQQLQAQLLPAAHRRSEHCLTIIRAIS